MPVNVTDAAMAATGSRDRSTLFQRLSSRVLPLRSLYRWYWTSALSVLAIECNLIRRIRWALEIRSWEVIARWKPILNLLPRKDVSVSADPYFRQ